jgi:hypothetical protein
VICENKRAIYVFSVEAMNVAQNLSILSKIMQKAEESES